MQEQWLKRYPASLFDEQLNLKATIPWLLVLFVLTLPTWYGLGQLVAKWTQGEWLPWVGFHGFQDYLISFIEQIPALMVLVLFLRRAPRAGRFIRALWRQQHWFLRLASSVQLAHLGYFAALIPASIDIFFVTRVVIYLWVTWYLVSSRFVSDFSKSFPPHEDIAPKSTSGS